MKSFLLSRLAHMTVAWFQKIALPVHCPSAISERKSQFKYQLGIWQDINKLAENKPTGNISSARIDWLSDGTCHPTSDCLGTSLYCINTPMGSQSHELCHQSYLLMCIFPQMPNRVLVKQILHPLHPWIISFNSFDQIRTDLPKIVRSYDC